MLYPFILPYMKYIVLKRLLDFIISKPSFSCTLKIHRISFSVAISRPKPPCFVPEDASQFGWINCELRKHHRIWPEKISQASKVYVAKIWNSFTSWALTCKVNLNLWEFQMIFFLLLLLRNWFLVYKKMAPKRFIKWANALWGFNIALT